VSLFLTWRRLGVLASVLWLGGLQVLLHQGLMVSSAGECMSPTQGNAREMVGGAMAVCSSQAPALELGWGPGRLAMTCAHLTAAVVLGLVLARGDRAVWFLARLVWPVLPASAPRVGLIPRLVWHGAPTISRARPVALTAVSRRGPPSWTAPACA
jgi:hypothetical protein